MNQTKDLEEKTKNFQEYTGGKSFLQLLGEDIKNLPAYLINKRISDNFTNEPLLIHTDVGYFFNPERQYATSEVCNAMVDAMLLEPKAFRLLSQYNNIKKILKKIKKTA